MGWGYGLGCMDWVGCMALWHCTCVGVVCYARWHDGTVGLWERGTVGLQDYIMLLRDGTRVTTGLWGGGRWRSAGWWHGGSKPAARRPKRPRRPRRRQKHLSSIYQHKTGYKFVETASQPPIKHYYPTGMQSNQSSMLAMAAAAASFARAAVGFGASWLDPTANRPHTSVPLALPVGAQWVGIVAVPLALAFSLSIVAHIEERQHGAS